MVISVIFSILNLHPLDSKSRRQTETETRRTRLPAFDAHSWRRAVVSLSSFRGVCFRFLPKIRNVPVVI